MAERTGLMARLATDDALREAIKADPRGVLRREGVDIPDGMQVKVVESTPDTLYIALPRKAEGKTEGELSDAELEGVAGGTASDITSSDISSTRISRL
jgi:Nitrile hydratase, alpha chain